MEIRWFTDYNGNTGERIPKPVWPDGWPVPRVGDGVVTPDNRELTVTAVIWYPAGDGDDSEQFVYVVLR